MLEGGSDGVAVLVNFNAWRPTDLAKVGQGQ